MAKKLKQGESYTRENRPKGVSKREWDKARKAEGKDPYAKFFADPVKERKAKEQQQQLSAKQKKEADDYIASVKAGTAVTPTGQGMSMAPDKAQAMGYQNPFTQQQPVLQLQDKPQFTDALGQGVSRKLTPEEQKQADDYLASIQHPTNPGANVADPYGVTKQEGILKTLARGLATPFVKGGLSVAENLRPTTIKSLFSNPLTYQAPKATMEMDFMGQKVKSIQKSGQDRAEAYKKGDLTKEQLVGGALTDAIDIASLLPIGKAVSVIKGAYGSAGKEVVKEVVKQTLGNSIKQGATYGAPIVGAYGVAGAMEENKSAGDVAKAGLAGVGQGAVGGGLLGAGSYGLGKGLAKLFGGKTNAPVAKQLDDYIKSGEGIDDTVKSTEKAPIIAPQKSPVVKSKAAEPIKTPKPEDSLMAEARKYKTEEEFLKAKQKDMVYHGSTDPLEQFDETGAFFSDDMNNADGYGNGENLYEGFLDMEKPLIIDAKGRHHSDLITKYGKSTREVVSNVDKKKYDGVIFKNINDSFADDVQGYGEDTIYYPFNAKKSFINESQLSAIYKQAHESIAPQSTEMALNRTYSGNKKAPVAQEKQATEVPQVYKKEEASTLLSDKRPDLSTPEKKIAYKNTLWDKTRTFVQDSWHQAKKLEKIAKPNSTTNPSAMQELYSGRLGARLENLSDEVASVDKTVASMEKQFGKDSMFKTQLNKYLQAKHTSERNLVHGEGASGMTNEEANTFLNGIKGTEIEKSIQKVGAKIKEMNSRTLEILKDGQVIDEKTYETLKNTYKEYVPLNRILPEEDDVLQALTGGKGLNVVGSGVKRAKGSNLEVADILTNTYANLGEAITRAEKNRVNLATLEFARNNKDLGFFEEIKPKAIGTSFDGKTPVLEQINDPSVLKIRENGKQVYLKIKDEGLAKMYQAIGTEKLPEAMKAIGAITRFYSSLATRFNPEFVFSNKIRDLQEMMVNVSAKEGIGFKGALKSGGRDLASMKSVTEALLGKKTPGAKLYNQMRMDGGTTGGMALSTRKNLEIDVNAIEKLNRSNPRKAVQALVNGIENWNTIFEDSTRLSVYKTALDKGMTRDQAALLAKNATLNFNKKGTAGPIINSLYMFSNASIQGTTNTLRAMKNPKVAGVVAGLVGTATYTVNKWNDSIDPDWRDKVSEWDRNSNLVIMLPSKDRGSDYTTFPVSWSIKPIKVMADRFYDTATGKGKGFFKNAEDILGAAIDAYNPIGGTDLASTITPTVLDLPADLARNKSWSGSNIKPDWMQGLPKADQYYKSLKDSTIGNALIKGTEAVSYGTGRAIDISPQDLNYVLDQLVGGAGRFVEKSANTISGLAKGEDVRARDIPFWSRFVKEKTEEEVRSSVSKKGINEAVEDLKKYKTGSDEQKQAIQKYLEGLPDDKAREKEKFILKDRGFDTDGISTSADVIRMKPVYDEISSLSEKERDKRINELSKEDYATYKSIERNKNDDGVSKTEEVKTQYQKETEGKSYVEKYKMIMEKLKKGEVVDSEYKKQFYDEVFNEYTGKEKPEWFRYMYENDSSFKSAMTSRSKDSEMVNTERDLLKMGVANNERANEIHKRASTMEGEERKAYLQNLIDKKIITKEVYKQLLKLKQ